MNVKICFPYKSFMIYFNSFNFLEEDVFLNFSQVAINFEAGPHNMATITV